MKPIPLLILHVLVLLVLFPGASHGQILETTWPDTTDQALEIQTATDAAGPWTGSGVHARGTDGSLTLGFDPATGRLVGGLKKSAFSGGAASTPEFIPASLADAETASLSADEGVAYTGLLEVPADGLYQFQIQSGGAAELFLNDKRVAASADGAGISAAMLLSAGEFVELGISGTRSPGDAPITLSWRIAKGALVPVPADALSLPIFPAEVFEGDADPSLFFRLVDVGAAADEPKGIESDAGAHLANRSARVDTRPSKQVSSSPAGETRNLTSGTPSTAAPTTSARMSDLSEPDYCIGLTSVATDAYEQEAIRAVYRVDITRNPTLTEPPATLTVQFQFLGAGNSPASLADVSLEVLDADGNLLPHSLNGNNLSVTVPVSIPRFDVHVVPTDDPVSEVPEGFELKLLSGTGYDAGCTLQPAPFSDSVTTVGDTDLFIAEDSYVQSALILDPGTPAGATLSNGSLKLWTRVNGASCEGDIELRLRDPAGNIVLEARPWDGQCGGSGPLYSAVLPVPTGAFTSAPENWTLEFRDINLQNGGQTEFSFRAAVLNYDVDMEPVDPTYTDSISNVSDSDLFVSDTVYVQANRATFPDPGTPVGATLLNGTLELWTRLDGASCEGDIEIRLRDPAGNVVLETRPWDGLCEGAGPLYYTVLQVPTGAFTGAPGDWILELRDTNPQNGGDIEFSHRASRLIYDVEQAPMNATCLAGRVLDATTTIDNDRFFVGALAPCNGDDQGTGFVSIRLEGDNSTAYFTIQALGLADGSYPVSGRILIPGHVGTIIPVPVTDYPWPISWDGTGAMVSDQVILDALLANQFQFVLATNNDQDELCATLGLTDVNYGPPDYTQYENEGLVDLPDAATLKRDVVRFLHQATFGPTDASVTELVDAILALDAAEDGGLANGVSGSAREQGFRNWIQAQKSLPVLPTADLNWWYDRYEWAIHYNDDNLFWQPGGTYNSTIQGGHHARHIFWAKALYAKGQLREKLAHALSEIFVVSTEDARIRTKHHGLASYNEMLATHSLGGFNRLLHDVSMHPIMGEYLSHRLNFADYEEVQPGVWQMNVSPDENYAREIMQLFSIGLVNLFPDGSFQLSAVETDATGAVVAGIPASAYTESDVREVARIFTGYNFGKVAAIGAGMSSITTDNHNFYLGQGAGVNQWRYAEPMKLFPQFHDGLAKTILGVDYTAEPGADYDMSSNTAANQADGSHLGEFITQLSEHPNIGPFIGRRMIQQLVTSNPSPGYLYRVSTAFAEAASSENLCAMMEAILLDPEARDVPFTRPVTERITFGRKRAPMRLLATISRVMGVESSFGIDTFDTWAGTSDLEDIFAGNASAFLGDTSVLPLAQYFEAGAGMPRNYSLSGFAYTQGLSQQPHSAPTVFNWYLPDYRAAGSEHAANGMVAPELQIVNSTQIMKLVNYLGRVSKGGAFSGSSMSIPDQTALGTILRHHGSLLTAGNKWLDLLNQSPEALVDELDLLLTGGLILEDDVAGIVDGDGNSMRQLILNLVNDQPGDEMKIDAAVLGVVQSPSFHIQQ